MATGYNRVFGGDTGHVIQDRVSVDEGGTKFVDTGGGGDGRGGSGNTGHAHIRPSHSNYIPNCLSHTSSTHQDCLSHTSSTQDCPPLKDDAHPIYHAQETTSNGSYIHVYISLPTMYTVVSTN